MEASRREALALAGAAAGMAMAGGARARDLGSAKKTLFWAAVVTPCDKNLRFDPGAMRDTLAYLKHNGADGVVVLGTTGEFPSFSVAERKLVAETVLQDKLGLNVIVNPGTSNFPETLELSRHAAAHGADGLLVIPPFYYDNPPTEGLIRYYSMLFDQVRIPINLYHIPGTSQVPISHELLRALMHYDNLAGIKDSTGNAEGYASFVEHFPELNMRSGTGNNLAYALDHGMGAILAEGNVFTRQCAAVFKAYRSGGDYHAAAQKMHDAIAVMKAGGIWGYGPMKYALSLQMDRPQTYQRPPNIDVTATQKVAIRDALAKIKDMA
ncbi:MAG TPA: dihydrodipicolinate synthase family protein [Caulobacteraceae bacterium]